LIDNHGRTINYLRIAVTDRCNLRCSYCMPAKGLEWIPRNNLLSFEEIVRSLGIFSELGINKIRFTGGEPFLRKDFIALVEKVCEQNLFEQISITTNGTLTGPHVARLKELGIHSVNLSLDTFDENRFFTITRRKDFEVVKRTFDSLLEHGITTRINAVIMEGKNEEDIVALANLTEKLPVDVRFIEEMPFNGQGHSHAIKWTAPAMIDYLRAHFGHLEKEHDDVNSTSRNYRIKNHAGRIGVIAAWSRSFCGTCNRIRITPDGSIKTCLYDQGQFSLRDLLRAGLEKEDIKEKIQHSVMHRAKDGFEAEQNRKQFPVSESMATIGG
jgi:molybdenum cofactor biosynthesis protein A